MSFEEVLGHEQTISRLESAIAGGRLAHGFIFAGPRGCGKTTLALALARRLLCKSSAPEDCDCPQCRKLRLTESGSVNHADVHLPRPVVGNQAVRRERESGVAEGRDAME